MTFDAVAQVIGLSFEVAAVLVLVVGFSFAVVRAAIMWRTSRDPRRAYRTLREMLGGGCWSRSRSSSPQT